MTVVVDHVTPAPPRNSRPTVPPSQLADRSPTPPRDRAVSLAADRNESALERAISQLADRFAKHFAAQAAAISEMIEMFEGPHRERVMRSTARNADDTPTAATTSTSTSHVVPRPIDSSRHDPNVLAAPSTAFSVAPNASTRPPLPFSVVPALTASAASQSLISISAPISLTVIAPSTRAQFVPVPLALPTLMQSIPLAADWDEEARNTLMTLSRRPRFLETSGNKIRGFIADLELYLQMCTRPVHHWGYFILGSLSTDEGEKVRRFHVVDLVGDYAAFKQGVETIFKQYEFEPLYRAQLRSHVKSGSE